MEKKSLGKEGLTKNKTDFKEVKKHTSLAVKVSSQISMPFPNDGELAFLTFFFIQLPNLYFRVNSSIILPEPQVLVGFHLGTHWP